EAAPGEMTSTKDERPSIAVLPFNNMSGDPEQEYFSDGITEDIITDLSRVSDLSVCARHSAFVYKGKAKHNLQIARRMFARAVEVDPRYARAYAGLADCDSHLLMVYQVDVPIDGILATAAKALALDDNLAEAHASRGVALSVGQRYNEAQAEFEKAIALDPNSFEAHFFYARFSFQQGNMDRARALYERAAKIKPHDYQSVCQLAQVYKSLGYDQESEAAARRGLELAEHELTAHPEDSRPAQLGAEALNSLKHDSDLELLRSHPRFQKLIKERGIK